MTLSFMLLINSSVIYYIYIIYSFLIKECEHTYTEYLSIIIINMIRSLSNLPDKHVKFPRETSYYTVPNYFVLLILAVHVM